MSNRQPATLSATARIPAIGTEEIFFCFWRHLHRQRNDFASSVTRSDVVQQRRACQAL